MRDWLVVLLVYNVLHGPGGKPVLGPGYKSSAESASGSRSVARSFNRLIRLMERAKKS